MDYAKLFGKKGGKKQSQGGNKAQQTADMLDQKIKEQELKNKEQEYENSKLGKQSFKIDGLDFSYEEILDAADFAKEELEKPLGPEYPDGYLFITMGAGDNWKLGKKILENK